MEILTGKTLTSTTPDKWMDELANLATESPMPAGLTIEVDPSKVRVVDTEQGKRLRPAQG